LQFLTPGNALLSIDDAHQLMHPICHNIIDILLVFLKEGKENQIAIGTHSNAIFFFKKKNQNR
jgi:hypothetical protein